MIRRPTLCVCNLSIIEDEGIVEASFFFGWLSAIGAKGLRKYGESTSLERGYAV